MPEVATIGPVRGGTASTDATADEATVGLAGGVVTEAWAAAGPVFRGTACDAVAMSEEEATALGVTEPAEVTSLRSRRSFRSVPKACHPPTTATTTTIAATV
jgi:hypothetical protein